MILNFFEDKLTKTTCSLFALICKRMMTLLIKLNTVILTLSKHKYSTSEEGDHTTKRIFLPRDHTHSAVTQYGGMCV